jgi:hypothetical protein
MINLSLNGTFLSSKRTKHIKARYFFIKDKIEEAKVEIRYCLLRRYGVIFPTSPSKASHLE